MQAINYLEGRIIKVSLFLFSAEHKNYIVYVKTGNAFASGTNSIVYLSMYGDKGESGMLMIILTLFSENISRVRRVLNGIF